MWPFNYRKPKSTNSRQSIPDDSPPPYPGSLSPLERSISYVETSIFLRGCIIEIMGLTFNVNFDALSTAINEHHTRAGLPIAQFQIPLGMGSILPEYQRDALMELSLMVQQLEKSRRRSQWNTTLERERSLVINTVIKAAIEIKMQPDYALYLIGSYADLRMHKLSLVERYMTSHRRLRWKKFFDMADTIRSHEIVITAVSVDENVRLVLGNAMQEFMKKKRIKKFKNDPWDFCWPISDATMQLYKALKPAGMIVKGDAYREMLRKKRRDG